MRKVRFLIAYGPTRERLDPVRFLSNDSTGTMGRFLVRAVKERGHAALPVSCPEDAESARDLQKKLRALLPRCDVLVMAAAVCDARPAKVSRKKIAKAALREIRLVKNPDILADLSKRKRKNQVFIGFGLESGGLLRKGYQKLREKGLDLIVMQKVSGKDRPFGKRQIDAVILSGDQSIVRFRSVGKEKLAGFLVKKTEELTRKVRFDNS